MVALNKKAPDAYHVFQPLDPQKLYTFEEIQKRVRVVGFADLQTRESFIFSWDKASTVKLIHLIKEYVVNPDLPFDLVLGVQALEALRAIEIAIETLKIQIGVDNA